MYRNNSFVAAGQLPVPSGVAEQANANENPHILYLKNQGKFGSKTLQPQAGGKLMTVWNYPARNKLWRLSLVAFHPRTGTFALADERGQVFRVSIHQHIYESIKLASTAVSALCFILTEKTHLVIAYESGSMVIVDTHKKDLVGNIVLQPPSAGPVVASIIRSHPTKPLLIIAKDSLKLSIWDLRLNRCTQTLACTENIIDLKFELQGDLIALCLEKTGVCFYDTETLQLMGQCTLENLTWTAYTSVTYRVYWEDDHKYRIHFNILLATTDNRLFSWYIGVNELPVPSGSRKKLTSVPLYELQVSLFGAFHLPLPFQSAVAMLFMGEVSQAPRFALLSSKGSVLLLESDGFHRQSAGILTILADIPMEIVQSNNSSQSSSSGSGTDLAQGLLAMDSAYGSRQGILGKMDCSFSHSVVISLDGAARLFVNEAMIGIGERCGKVLKAKVYDPLEGKSGQQKENRNNIKNNNSNHNNNRNRNNTQTMKKDVSSSNNDTHSSSGGSNLYDFYLADTNEDDYYDEETGGQGGGQQQRKYKRLVGAASATSTAARRSSSARSASSSAKTAAALPSSSNRTATSAAHAPMTRRVKWSAHSFLTGSSSKGSPRGSSINNKAVPGASTTGPHLKGIDLKKLDIVNLPLFELAALTPREKQVNRVKLQAFLYKHGEYPMKFRPLIWRFLLKLPENTEAFADLANRGIHPMCEDLQDSYPIKSPKIFARLQNACSQICHWAPIFSQVTYLPSLVFPFTLIHTADELATLETMITLFMYWGHSWCVTHPHPPIHLVDSMNNLLKLHEIKLYQHFIRFGISPGLFGWQMLSTLFSEILSRSAWLAMIDYLFTYFEKMALLILAPIAIMKDMKSVFLEADSAQKMIQAFRSQQSVRIDYVIKDIEQMKKDTPAKYFTGVATKYLSPTRFEVGGSKQGGGVMEADSPGAGTGTGSGSDNEGVANNIMEEEDEARENMALANGEPRFPLPKSSHHNYPVYDGFPQELVDIQMRERNKVLSLTKEVTRRESVLKTLEKKIAEVESDHSNWTMKHHTATETELNYRRAMMEKEKQHLRDLQQVEEEISRQRLRHLEAVETSAKEERHLLDQALDEAQRFMLENEQHVKEKMAMQLALQHHREVAEKAEVTTMEKMRQLRLRRTREDWLKSVSNLLSSQEQEIALEDQVLQEQWKRQDDEKRLQRDRTAQELSEREELDRLALIQEEIAQRMKRLQFEREKKLLEIERIRAVRVAKEQAEEAMEAAERSAMFMKKQELLDLATANNQQHQQKVASRAAATGSNLAGLEEDKLSYTMQGIAHERDNILHAEKATAIRALKARQSARQAQFQKESAEEMAASIGIVTQEQEEELAQAHQVLQKISQRTRAPPPASSHQQSSKQTRPSPQQWEQQPQPAAAATAASRVVYDEVKEEQELQEEKEIEQLFHRRQPHILEQDDDSDDNDDSQAPTTMRRGQQQQVELTLEEAMQKASRALLQEQQFDDDDNDDDLNIMTATGKSGKSNRSGSSYPAESPSLPPTWTVNKLIRKSTSFREVKDPMTVQAHVASKLGTTVTKSNSSSSVHIVSTSNSNDPMSLLTKNKGGSMVDLNKAEGMPNYHRSPSMKELASKKSQQELAAEIRGSLRNIKALTGSSRNKQPSVSPEAATAPAAAASGRMVNIPSSSRTMPSRSGPKDGGADDITLDSDTALWAFDDKKDA